MAKSKKTLEITQTKTKANRQEIQINDMDYTTSAEPKAFADGRPVFCAHDKIVPIKELRENPLNPNKHPDDQIRALAAIIKATGWRQPITVSTRSGLIVKGHGRLAAAKYGKFKEAPVDYQNYASEEEELADLMADNRIAELAEIDSVKLAEAFEAVDTGAIPFEMTGYEESFYQELATALCEADHEDAMLSRREQYDAELPDDVLVLTVGVDTQDNRLEYEVVGHGLYGETWGIKKGIINGRPDTSEVWARLDDVIDHVYRFKNGKGLKVSFTCVDSGGHFTQEVYAECKARQNKRVFAIKGKGGDGIPYTAPPSKVKIVIDGKLIGKCWLYTLGVDAGKSKIMNAIKVQEKGAKYCHFPLGEDRGYDSLFFSGLLSEKLSLVRTRRGDKWQWEKLPGHNRNEALDCRNYAMAAFRILDPDLTAVERRLKGQPLKTVEKKEKKKRSSGSKLYDDW